MREEGGGRKRTVRKSPRGETNSKYQQTQKRTNHETRHKKKDQSTKSTHKIKENPQVRPSGSEEVMSIDNEALTAHRLSQCLETKFPLVISQTARQTGGNREDDRPRQSQHGKSNKPHALVLTATHAQHMLTPTHVEE